MAALSFSGVKVKVETMETGISSRSPEKFPAIHE
jgi:hypothetical protein